MYDSLFYTFPLVDMTVPIEGLLPIWAGATTKISGIVNEPGGPANILIAASRVGMNMLPVGVVGDDYYGSFLLEAYRAEGISLAGITLRPGMETRKVLVLVDESGNHSYISMLEGVLEPLRDLEEKLKNSRSLCISGYMLLDSAARGEVLRALRLAAAMGKVVFFDPGPLIPQIPPECMAEVLASSTAVVLNDDEAALLTGCAGVEKAAALILKKGALSVVVKAGGKGCYFLEASGECGWYEGFSVPLVDTTGAGDSFLGAFMFAYLSCWDRETIAHFSNAMGAAKVAKRGSGTQVPTFDELVAVLEQGGFSIHEKMKRERHFQGLVLHRGA